jgi:hypothetical protein
VHPNALSDHDTPCPKALKGFANKQKMGFYGTSRIWYLKQFDAYCAAHGRTVLDRDTVEGWVSQQLTRSG